MGVSGAAVVLGCRELAAALDFFTEELGFRVDEISPADDPRYAIVSGHGVRLQLDRDAPVGPVVLRLFVSADEAGQELTAPNGTVVQFVDADPPPPASMSADALAGLPAALTASITVNRFDEPSGGPDGWVEGRAGMRYRDLVPDRRGGRLIASHIAIPGGGPVPDYVHHHRIRFQLIFCRRGWVRVVYEDQGPPFVLEPGDCVLQPPGIRHRVLESSPGLEVIELSSPAEHRTLADHELALPTEEFDPDRVFVGELRGPWGGQRFVRHQRALSAWGPWPLHPGFLSQDTGIAAATGGLLEVRVVRSGAPAQDGSDWRRHDGELCFLYVLAGALTLDTPGSTEGAVLLSADDNVVIPPGLVHALRAGPGTELLEVSVAR